MKEKEINKCGHSAFHSTHGGTSQNKKYTNLLVLVDFSFPVPLVVWAFCHTEGDVSI